VRALEPLRVRPFSRLLGTYFVNELGDVFGVIALAILVFDETGDPLAPTALFVAARFIPAFCSPILTARLDQLAVGRTLAMIYAVEAAVFCALALLAEHFVIVAVLALAFVDGTLALTARGITRGAVAATLGTGEPLRAGNALINIAFAVASVAGAILAGVIVDAAGVSTALVLDAGSFGIAAVLIVTAAGLAVGGERAPFLERFREGLRHVRHTAALRGMLILQATALLLFTLVVPIEVVYAKRTLDAGDIGLGVLMAAWGAGMVIGSWLFVSARRLSTVVLALTATALVGAGYLGMGLVRDLLAASLFSVIGGIGNGTQWVSVMTYLQQNAPLELQARLSGLLESIGAAMPGLGFLLGGLLTSATDAPTTFLVAGAGVLGLVLIAGFALLYGARRPA
jgi:MFS family permease